MGNNHELFQLTTRRYIAFGLGGLATTALAFVVVFGLILLLRSELAVDPVVIIGLVGTALGGLIAIVSGIIGFYFGKKEA